MLQKAKNWLMLVLAAIVTLLAATLFGRKSKWAKEKERQVEKADKKIKIKEKEKEKADEAIKEAEEDAKKAVHDYAEIKKTHDEKIKKAGDKLNVNEKEDISGPADTGNFLNDLLSELHGKDN